MNKLIPDFSASKVVLIIKALWTLLYKVFTMALNIRCKCKKNASLSLKVCTQYKNYWNLTVNVTICYACRIILKGVQSLISSVKLLNLYIYIYILKKFTQVKTISDTI